MDYRNADGSFSEMCGNGIRLFVRYLVDEGLADGSAPIPVDTRDGVKTLTVDGDLITVDMGTPKVLGDTAVSVGERTWPARHVDMGNPHAVAFVDSLDDAGRLFDAADPRPGDLPRRRERRVRRTPRRPARRDARPRARLGRDPLLRHRRLRGDGGRGSRRRRPPGASNGYSDVAYRVDVPGGTLTVTWTADDRVLLTGPAVIVASGETDL